MHIQNREESEDDDVDLILCLLLQHVEVPIPTPIRNEVLVKLEAASLNPVDWKIQKGQLRPLFPLNFPLIPCNAAFHVIMLCFDICKLSHAGTPISFLTGLLNLPSGFV